MTTTFASLDQLLSEAIGDWIEEDTTTPLATNNFIISSNLAKFTNNNNALVDRWAYITVSTGNAGEDRKVSASSASSNSLTVLGNAWSCDSSGNATFRLYRYSRTNKEKAINRAIEEVYPHLHRKMENKELITGNALLPFIWPTSTSLREYSTSSATIAKTTDVALIWNGETSVKVTASAGNGYLVLSSETYPRLLDLMNTAVNFKCWAYPEDANDAKIEIYTLKADGTTSQTLTSTTDTPAGQWTLISDLTNQSINNEIVQIEFRFKVTTNAKYVYFSFPRVTGRNLYEYMLPDDFKENSKISQVYIQTEGYSDDPCDDKEPRVWDRVFGFDPNIYHTDTYRYIRLPDLYSIPRQIKLVGSTRLESLSSASDTISLDGEKINLLIAYAAYKLYEMEAGTASSEDRSRLLQESEQWRSRYERLKPNLRMMRHSGTINLSNPY